MVTGHRKGPLGVEILADAHVIISDVSTQLGGLDEGADPHRLLEASLTACTIMTLQMYAQLKKIDLSDTEVMVRIDSEGSETNLTREIKLIGNLSTEQRARLIEIANKCPIHRLLNSKIKIETKEI